MEPKTCLRCGNEWTPRKEHPKRCPGCQNPNWNRPRKRAKKIEVEIVHVPRSEWPAEVVKMLDDAIQSTEPECAHAPDGKDSLSSAKAKAEALMRQLTA